MDIGSVTTSQSSASTSRVGLADDFDSFLVLLTTQLKNQDPTAPMDADQFTQQLVQFSGVEQQITTNETLSKLTNMMQQDQISRGVDYLGTKVEARGETVRLGEDGTSTINYELDGEAASVSIIVRDEQGQVVSSMAGNGADGRHTLVWEGPSGRPSAEGMYRFDITAKNANGDPITVDTTVTGTVDGVEYQSDRVMLSVGGVLMPLDSIASVRRPDPVELAA